MIIQPLVDYYRCPEEWLDFDTASQVKGSNGYFRFSPDVICYGQTEGYASPSATGTLFDASEYVRRHGRTTVLPFDLPQIVDNLRYERYVSQSSQKRWLENAWITRAYYLLRPLFPVVVRKHFQKMYLRGWETIPFPIWPVDCSVDRLFEKLLVLAIQARPTERVPFIWFWPQSYNACAIVTHDVETTSGRDFSERLMDLDDAYGIKASFQIVPEKRYTVSSTYLASIRERGFEICLQGLDHVGNLFGNREVFLRHAKRINSYAKQFEAQGFRSPILYRNIDWFKDLSFSYDMSVPNVARLEAQRGGCCTVMPFFLPGGMVELPLTTTEDYTLFHILDKTSLDLWQQQCNSILERHGLMTFLVHPDYVIPQRAQDIYKALLAYINRLQVDHQVWLTLPGEASRWWRARSEMKLVPDSTGWKIEGEGSERARVAYARIERNRLVYEVDS